MQYWLQFNIQLWIAIIEMDHLWNKMTMIVCVYVKNQQIEHVWDNNVTCHVLSYLWLLVYDDIFITVYY